MERGCPQSDGNVTFCLRNKSPEVTLGSILALNNWSHGTAGPSTRHQVLFLAQQQNVCTSQEIDCSLIIILGKLKQLMVS